MRGLAALVVLIFHCSSHAEWPNPVPAGYLAVDLFFLMSGFVIAQAYAAKLASGMSVRAFILLRLRRLYPLYLLGQVLGLAVALAALWQGIAGFTFAPIAKAFAVGWAGLPVPVEGVGDAPPVLPLNGPSWSLFWEFGINIAWALALPWLNRRVLIAILAIGAAALLATAAKWDDLHVGFTAGHAIGGGARVLYSFTAGLLLYRFRPKVGRNGNWGTIMAYFGTLGLLIIGVQSARHDVIVVLAAFPALVLAAIRFQPGGAIAAASKWLGRISYPLYIVHQPILLAVELFVMPEVGTGARPGIWIATIIAIIALSDGLDRVFDRPVRRALARLSATDRPAAASDRGAAF
jgi:peptidoglycan/LPS O-acetylase OafA/YrhL